MSAQVYPFHNPNKEYPPPDICAADTDPLTDIRQLRLARYRQNNPSAVEAGKRFRRIFQGPWLWPFLSCFRLGRKRTHKNLVRLLIGQRLAENTQDAERFISDILGAQIPLSSTRWQYCTLERVPRKDAYFLWYTPL
jgi:hypothetical protein